MVRRDLHRRLEDPPAALEVQLALVYRLRYHGLHGLSRAFGWKRSLPALTNRTEREAAVTVDAADLTSLTVVVGVLYGFPRLLRLFHGGDGLLALAGVPVQYLLLVETETVSVLWLDTQSLQCL